MQKVSTARCERRICTHRQEVTLRGDGGSRAGGSGVRQCWHWEASQPPQRHLCGSLYPDSSWHPRAGRESQSPGVCLKVANFGAALADRGLHWPPRAVSEGGLFPPTAWLEP